MNRLSAKPNILWISLEDTSPRFGCYGDKIAVTPNIDRLASEGVIFRNAFSTAGVCAPSRSAVITGMYQTFLGTQHMRTTHKDIHLPELPTPYFAVLPAYVKTFTEYLRRDGYYCSNNAKTDYQFEPPFTAWDDCSRNAHWRNREPDQPFFAVFNPTMTHESCMWGEETPDTNPDNVQMPPYLPNTPKARESLARYYDQITKADRIVGDILRQLEEDGLADNTIVFLWSDHGEGLPRAKRWPYDAGIRVPMIVRWPGQLQAGTESEQLVSLVDLAPTVLTLAGVDVPAHLQGQSFLGDGNANREYVFATRDRYDTSYDLVRAVRSNRFKYIRNYYPENPYLQWIPFSHQHPALQELWRLYLENGLTGSQSVLMQNSRPPEELYDCVEDPYELVNLANHPDYLDELKKLRTVMDDWCTRFDPFRDVPESEMVRRMWPDGVQPQTAAPIMVPIHAELPGREPTLEGTFSQRTMIMLVCATQGASLAYTTEEGENPNWRLYTGPIVLEQGKWSLRAKAVRIGYKMSEVTEAQYRVSDADSN